LKRRKRFEFSFVDLTGQKIDLFSQGRVPVQNDQLLILESAAAASGPIADLAQQLLFSDLDPGTFGLADELFQEGFFLARSLAHGSGPKQKQLSPIGPPL